MERDYRQRLARKLVERERPWTSRARREKLDRDWKKMGFEAEPFFPEMKYCTDNAAMIAGAGAARLARGERTSFDIRADPNLRLAS